MVRTLHILVVEDSPGDRRLLAEALKHSKSHLHFVEDGIEAIHFLRKLEKYINAPRPSLIILDQNLPRKSGREALREIKEDPDLRQIPIVIFSTSVNESDINACYNLHANCYISKPSELDRFFTVVQEIERYWLETAQLGQ